MDSSGKPARTGTDVTAAGAEPAGPGPGIVLGENRYGKSEIRLLRVERDDPARHRIRDLCVSTLLSGDLTGAHLDGDNSAVLPTDTQKNTVYAFAAEGIGEPEEFASRLARHFVRSQPAITRAVVTVTEYPWREAGGTGHSFASAGSDSRSAETRWARVSWQEPPGPAAVSGGLDGLVLLNTTGSAFTGFARDRYTTLAEASDRILATAVSARWRYQDPARPADWARCSRTARETLIATFARTPSPSLQHTLYAMGSAVLAAVPELEEVGLSLPNRHHFLVDLTAFGLENESTVYLPADRPYGLIEGTVRRAG